MSDPIVVMLFSIRVLNAFIGDFHFVWECLRVIVMSVWGSERDKGSLCHLKDVAGSMLEKRSRCSM